MYNYLFNKVFSYTLYSNKQSKTQPKNVNVELIYYEKTCT